MTKEKWDSLISELSEMSDYISSFNKLTVEQCVNSKHKISHFTNWSACVAILGKDKPSADGLELWASDASCLNDSLEGRELFAFANIKLREIEALSNEDSPPPAYLSGNWQEPLENGDRDAPFMDQDEWTELSKVLNSLGLGSGSRDEEPLVQPTIAKEHAYLISFCETGDRLDLWRAYTEKATGVSLTMPLKTAVETPPKGFAFYRVSYDDLAKTRALTVLKNPMRALIEALPDKSSDKDAWNKKRDEIVSALGVVPLLFKHPAFSTEMEIRLVGLKSQLQHAGRKPEVVPIGEIPRVVFKTGPFFLDRHDSYVTLGPRCADRNPKSVFLAARLNEIFETTRSSSEWVRNSDIPFL